MLEHPSITRSELDGGDKESKVVAHCFVCGNVIYEGEPHYSFEVFKICQNYNCKCTDYEKHAGKMFQQYHEDMDTVLAGMDWYFENYAKKGEKE